jgi:Arc/MetJ family transcription regulator
MKRTNLVLDEHLLEEATRILAARTYSAAVNTALAELIRVRKVQGIRRFVGSGSWEGNLSEMREDQPSRRRK